MFCTSGPVSCCLCRFIVSSLHSFSISLLFPEHGTPTSVAFVATDPNQVVVSFDAGETLLYDLNTEQSVTALETQTKDGMRWTFWTVNSPLCSRLEMTCEHMVIEINETDRIVCFLSQAASWSTVLWVTRLSPSPSLHMRTAPSDSWITKQVLCWRNLSSFLRDRSSFLVLKITQAYFQNFAMVMFLLTYQYSSEFTDVCFWGGKQTQSLLWPQLL